MFNPTTRPLDFCFGGNRSPTGTQKTSAKITICLSVTEERNVSMLASNADQAELFEGDTWRQTFKLMPKLPFKFSYRFQDAAGKQSEMQVLDWETGQLFWNCRRAADGDERMALAKVREKYIDQFLKTDLHFFLGATKEFHSWATNPFLIIGVFPIPHEKQLGLL